MKIIEALGNVLLVLWVGGLWVIGYISAPVLFSNLERKTAGQVAGIQFEIIGWLGLVCGLFLVISVFYRLGKVWQFWVLITMMALVAISVFGIQPQMQELKAAGLVPGSETAASFGKLHGLSSVLYLLTSLMGLALVVKPASSRS